MLDGLQLENKTLFDLVQLQETRINYLKVKVKDLETQLSTSLRQSDEKDADPSSGAAKK